MSIPGYVIRAQNRERTIRTVAELERMMLDARSSAYSDVWIVQCGTSLAGFERLLYRALGLRTELDGPSVSVLGCPVGACVTFLDEDFNEYTLLSEVEQSLPASEVEFELDNGQRIRVTADEVVSHDAAFDAVRHFFEHGERPASLPYRQSRKKPRSKKSKTNRS